jgi:hypothetical protein
MTAETVACEDRLHILVEIKMLPGSRSGQTSVGTFAADGSYQQSARNQQCYGIQRLLIRSWTFPGHENLSRILAQLLWNRSIIDRLITQLMDGKYNRHANLEAHDMSMDW